jgi:hypothetical protein
MPEVAQGIRYAWLLSNVMILHHLSDTTQCLQHQDRIKANGGIDIYARKSGELSAGKWPYLY